MLPKSAKIQGAYEEIVKAAAVTVGILCDLSLSIATFESEFAIFAFRLLHQLNIYVIRKHNQLV